MISLASAVRSCDTRSEAALILSDAPDVISCIYNRGNTSFGAPRTGRLQSARMEWRLSRIITKLDRERKLCAVARLGRSVARLIRISMARMQGKLNAPVGAEVFSLVQQQFEKYGLRASNKPCDFNYIKNPYQIAVVQRSREKPRRENTGDAVWRFGSAELRRESPAKRGDFHVVASQERKLATTRLAEREEPESNILQLCPLSKYLDSEAFCSGHCVPPRGSRKPPDRRAKFESHYVRLAHKFVRSIITPIRHRDCR